MSKAGEAIAVNILGKEYRIACEPGAENELLSAARFLDARMREVRGSGKVIGMDRIAVMVALNLAHELLEEKSEQDSA
ncbi:MAG: cell division protein ZapA, partial [Gammaproteobacteria bacterium]|nr:cell division protein ZapA [Gammaproteobacteria bacterium]